MATDQQPSKRLKLEPEDLRQRIDEPPFPEEIWCAIFRNLSGRQLLQARLVCRQWNGIIGSSSELMDKVVLRVPDETIQEGRLLPTTETGFVRVKFNEVTIPEDLSRTAAGLSSLTTLIFQDCNVTVRTLLGLLKETPNLQSLTVGSKEEFDLTGVKPEDFDFKLRCLKELNLYFWEPNNKLLDIFSQICARLKVLHINFAPEDENDEDEQIEHRETLIKFVRTVRNTIEDIVADFEGEDWIRVAEIEGLRLRRIQTYICSGEQLIEITRKQSAIEDLIIAESISGEDFLKIGRSLPQLKSLEIHLVRLNDSSMIPNFMPQLKHLKLLAKLDNLNIGDLFPNLHSVHLTDSTNESRPELLDSLAKLKNLKQLKLGQVFVTGPSDKRIKSLENLKYLKLNATKMPKPIFSQLITQSPDLREVSLICMDTLDDDDILLVCSKLRLLRSLCLFGCKNVTQNVADHIINCLFLEEVTFQRGSRIFDDSARRIRQYRNDVLVKYVDYSSIE